MLVCQNLLWSQFFCINIESSSEEHRKKLVGDSLCTYERLFFSYFLLNKIDKIYSASGEGGNEDGDAKWAFASTISVLRWMMMWMWLLKRRDMMRYSANHLEKNRNNLIRIEKMWNGNELGSSSLNELERSLNISICTVSLRIIETLN